MVIMLRGENSKDVVSQVKSAVPGIQNSLPKEVRINVFYDRTTLIQACIKTVMDTLMEVPFSVIFRPSFHLLDIKQVKFNPPNRRTASSNQRY